MKIGIFSGSFNPIHVGHLMLANYIVEFTDIDQVWLLITPQNPFKQNVELLPEDIRFQMAKVALKDYRNIEVSNFEFSLPRPSYTINSLNSLKTKYPEHSFTLIIGADNWVEFEKWKNADQIITDFGVYVYPRLNFEIVVPEAIESKINVLNSPIVEISSTFIRDSIKGGKDVRSFVSESVYDFIKSNNLYSR